MPDNFQRVAQSETTFDLRKTIQSHVPPPSVQVEEPDTKKEGRTKGPPWKPKKIRMTRTWSLD